GSALGSIVVKGSSVASGSSTALLGLPEIWRGARLSGAICRVRRGLNKSGVTDCALALVSPRAISTRQAKAARKSCARGFRPRAGGAITMRKLQRNHILRRQSRAYRETCGQRKKVVNGVKTIMVNDPLRTERSRVHRPPRRAKQAARRPPLFRELTMASQPL